MGRSDHGDNHMVRLNQFRQLPHLARPIDSCLDHPVLVPVRIDLQKGKWDSDQVIEIPWRLGGSIGAQQARQQLLCRGFPAAPGDSDNRAGKLFTMTPGGRMQGGQRVLHHQLGQIDFRLPTGNQGPSRAHGGSGGNKVMSVAAGSLKGNKKVPQPHFSGVVFGCGGERDRNCRPAITRTVLEHADLALATADNPRGEGVEAIFADMRPGGHRDAPIVFVPDRRRAISLALNEARSGDTVLILGKGHETYQDYGEAVVPFDDRAVVQELISQKAELEGEIDAIPG